MPISLGLGSKRRIFLRARIITDRPLLYGNRHIRIEANTLKQAENRCGNIYRRAIRMVGLD